MLLLLFWMSTSCVSFICLTSIVVVSSLNAEQVAFMVISIREISYIFFLVPEWKNFKRIWTIIRLTWATDSTQNKRKSNGQILNRLQCIGMGKSPKPSWILFYSHLFIRQWKKGKFGKFWAGLGKFGQVWVSLGKFGQVGTSLEKATI